ncbi:Mus7/MMS22 family-domain-containing protein, partial [Calycina marina]
MHYMASWKEKGVVPDSDEEEDSQQLDLEISNHPDGEDGSHIQEKETWEGADTAAHIDDIITPCSTSKAVNRYSETSVHHGIALEALAAVVDREGSAVTDAHFAASAGDIEVPGIQMDSTTGASTSKADMPPPDEISKSYVCISSPMMSPSSSVLSSQKTGNLEKARPNTAPESQAFEEEITYEHGRALRHRNANQIKPFTTEQYRHSAFMKAHGMAPIRLEQTPDEHGHRSKEKAQSKDDSQEPYSQGIDIDTQGSQQENIESTPSPQPIHRNSVPRGSGNTRETTGSESDDDELPDMDGLLSRRHKPSNPSKKTQTKKIYSTKVKFKKPKGLNFLSPNSVPEPTSESADVFDVPASPPITSPMPNSISGMTSKSARRSLSMSLSLPEAAVATSSIDELGLDFLTPATSPPKQLPSPILVDSESDSDDPFASELEADVQSAAVESSSEESVRFRNVKKKIRGVLPASHLRLDIPRKPSVPDQYARRFLSLSPESGLVRRGVAVPRVGLAGTPKESIDMVLMFSDESDASGEDQSRCSNVGPSHDASMDFQFGQHRIGFANEDDRIDTMLLTKRRVSTLTGGLPKKRRAASGAALASRQPRITDHLTKPEGHDSTKSSEGVRAKSRSHRLNRAVRRSKNPQPPRLSILDVTNGSTDGESNIPLFIKIATRSARSRRDQGRQTPSKKFIRLATREDTIDAQSVLQDWKDGKIKRRNISMRTARQAPSNIERQTKLQSPTKKARGRASKPAGSRTSTPRSLVISNPRQRPMNEFITIKDQASESATHTSRSLSESNAISGSSHSTRLLVTVPQAHIRSAQLETTVAEFANQCPTIVFKGRKKLLDGLYRNKQRPQAQKPNLPLSRFLADDEIVPSVEGEDVSTARRLSVRAFQKPLRLRKRVPRRLDVGASVFRQPSEPLILNHAAPIRKHIVGPQGKLLGLGKFGTKYPIQFDIHPLPLGVYFHSTTFIGSSHIFLNSPDPSTLKSPLSFKLGEMECRWCQWDENVSSEIGLCFDWILDQLFREPHRIDQLTKDDSLQTITFVVEYVQNHMVATSPPSQSEIMNRMKEVLEDFASRLDAEAGNALSPFIRVGVLCRCASLGLQLLLLSRTMPSQPAMSSMFEVLLLRFAEMCISALLENGMGDVRALYDKLQYISFRESGIDNTHRAAEAWVVIINTLRIAKIPRGSFWDLTNVLLLEKGAVDLTDAGQLEQLWYTVFSLLPLCEFNASGVLISGVRHSAQFDNWTVPQRILKSLFALYSSQSRQSPSFNDYCRTVLSRCLFLMMEWGWWKCGALIGTLFDFFASQNLANLRNEEVHSSPHFLDELSAEPSLRVEPEDRFFHIFLKIIALEIKHLRKTNDEKDLRNIIPRLLPNNNRQHPKEAAISERELAALRNRHDLLVTLYWAAPPNLRPSPTLIQTLVEPEISHSAACLINLRAWSQLSRFLAASPDTAESFGPLDSWRSSFLNNLPDQYSNEETNTRRQVERSTNNLYVQQELELVFPAFPRNILLIYHCLGYLSWPRN